MSDSFTYTKFIPCHLILDIIIPTFIKRIDLRLRETQDHITGKSQSWDSPRSVCPISIFFLLLFLLHHTYDT